MLDIDPVQECVTWVGISKSTVRVARCASVAKTSIVVVKSISQMSPCQMICTVASVGIGVINVWEKSSRSGIHKYTYSPFSSTKCCLCRRICYGLSYIEDLCSWLVVLDHAYGNCLSHNCSKYGLYFVPKHLLTAKYTGRDTAVYRDRLLFLIKKHVDAEFASWKVHALFLGKGSRIVWYQFWHGLEWEIDKNLVPTPVVLSQEPRHLRGCP